MATTRHYWNLFKAVRDQIAMILGVDITRSNMETRAGDDASLAAVSALAKALVDKGTLTESDITTALGGAVSSDGSYWDPEASDVPYPWETTGAWDAFPGENFESGTNGIDATALNTAFAGGQVGDLLPGDGSMKFTSAQHQSGSLGLNVTMNNNHSRGLRTATYDPSETWFTRFYFKAAVAPTSPGIVEIMRSVDLAGDGTSPVFSFGYASDGYLSMFVAGVGRLDSTPHAITDGNWWRVEAGIYVSTTGPVCELRFYTGANLSGTTVTDSFQGTYDGASRISSVLLGQYWLVTNTDTSYTYYVDDVAFSSSGWIGP